ncbi:MAG: diphthine--ammonia ligase [bacterium]
MNRKVILSWSGGKDSALCLHAIRQAGRYEVAALLTTVTEGYQRVSMHGVREELLEDQAASLGVPLDKVPIPMNGSNEEYEGRMKTVLEKWLAAGVARVAFGDIFLEDLRKYREDNLAKLSMQAHFPLWKKDTAELARQFIRLGFRAVVTCVDCRALDRSFAGREIDERFLADLPAGADPCGENGEFHSFVWDGPLFRRPVRLERGQAVLRDERFCFCDLLPAGEPAVDFSITGTAGRERGGA